MHCILTIKEDPETGELILPFNQQLLEALGWNPGDTIRWSDNGDGSWTLTKKETE